MDRIQHLAFGTPDVVKTANFYKEVFGLRETSRVYEATPAGAGVSEGELLRRLWLTDGNIAIAICKDTHAERTPGGARMHRVGFYHMGFVVENVSEARKRLDAKGALFLPATLRTKLDPQEKEGSYCKYKGPEDIIIDVSQHGWQV